MTPKSVLPLLLIIAVIFAPLGIVMLLTSYNVQQIVIDYTKCDTLAKTSGYTTIDKKYYSQHFKKTTSSTPKWMLQNKTVNTDDDNSYDTTVCRIEFSVPNSIKAPIYMYYKLTNFYQNHREYVESYDLDQLKGKAVNANDLNHKCSPIKIDGNNKAYYPCGLIANSYFNDTFSSPVLLNPQGASESEKVYNMSTLGISWLSDKKRWKKTSYDVSSIVPPPNWAKRYPNGYTKDNLPDISKDESLQNWMRTAGLPDFMKLVSKNEDDLLEDGNYRVDIHLNYPTSIYGGTKSLVLTTNSIIGGRNVSLGVVYLVVAGICVLFGIIFLMKQIIRPRKIGDNKYLDFNKNELAPNRGFRDIL